MEDDVDIYADLPSLNLNPENKDQDCNCKELKKQHSVLLSKLENLQRINANLENNLSSLLKTARAEITRKDRMIDDLRQRLNDITFRRSNRNEGYSTHRSSQQRNITRKYEDVSSIHSEESETEPHEIGFCQNKYKSRKLQNDVNRVPTVFGERLHKKIMETEQEEKKQKALLKLGAEVKTEDISKDSIVENDKENGSQFSINNNTETNIRRCSSSEPPYKKNLVKRTSEEVICKYKRLKIESNEDKTTTKEMDYLTRCDLTENPAQYEIKDGVKSEDQLDTAHSFKKEEAIPFRAERRAVSEYQDTKQDQSCANGWRSEAKSNSSKDHDNSNIRNGLAYSLRNSRSASTSNYASERSNSGYRKNGHRYNSPPRRSYSRSRSDYESSHRLRERSSKTYREKKYDDYKYDSRYKNDRLRRNHDSEENDRKTRYKRREHDDLREKSRYSSSDAEDRESNSSYKKKYENRKIKKEIINVSNDKKPHESKVVVEINSRESSSRTIVNSTMNCTYSAEKNIEKHKNVSEIKSINSTESISAHKEHPVHKESTSVVKKDLDILEEGEILDSPEKKISSAKISNDNKIEENNIIILVGDKNKVVSVNASRDDKSIPFKNYTNSTKQLEMDTDTKEIEVVSCLPQGNLKDCEEIIQLTSSKCVVTADEVHNCIKDGDTRKLHINDKLTNSTTRNIGTTEEVHDSDIDGNDKNDADEKSEDFITETAIKIKQVTDSNIESVSQIQELNHLSIESTKKEETSTPNIESAVEVTEVNNFNSDNSIHKIDNDELRTSISKVVTKVEAVLNCDIAERDENRAPIESETFHQTSNKSSVEALYLNDHNYVQSFPVNASDLDANQKPSMNLGCGGDVSETAVSKETKVEKTINVQSISVKKTMSSVVKNKKDQQSKGILISHRRKAVILSDSNASMTVLMNTNIAKTSSVINNCNDNDSTLKPRACKTSRVSAKATCK